MPAALPTQRRAQDAFTYAQKNPSCPLEPWPQLHVLEDTMGFFERWWAYLLGGFILILMAVGEG